MLYRGMYADALAILNDYRPTSPPDAVRQLAIQSFALMRQHRIPDSVAALAHADQLCRSDDIAVCGDVLRTHAILAVRQGNRAQGRQILVQTLNFARAHQDQFLAASVAVNLGWQALQTGHFDEAVDWSRGAYRDAQAIGAEDLQQAASGNLGWAFYELGDGERALEQYREAERNAAKLGDTVSQLKWISTAGYVYRDSGDLARATDAYRQAYTLATRIDSREDIDNALEDLAQVSLDSANLTAADSYLAQVSRLELAATNRLSANVRLTQGMLAAAQHNDSQAQSLLLAVRDEAANPTTIRLLAGDQLGRLFERQGNRPQAEATYRDALATFEKAREQLKSEETTLPFVANATGIYDDYIHLLVTQGHPQQALQLADQSRARTLAQSLGVASTATSVLPDPRLIARKSGATLLFYWLGAQHSWLWAVTPDKISIFPLPAEAEILPRLDRYRHALIDSVQDPIRNANPDGLALYQILVAPAQPLIAPNRPVMILADGALTQLNFETLLVPGAPSTQPHYLIQDATLLSAPSLATLARAQPARPSVGRLLLLGNPLTVTDDFPNLPLFGYEMSQIQRHFHPAAAAVFSAAAASPAHYFASNPAQFAYIHFVAHAVASSTDPLDSAIILSGPAEGAYKLYARDIMQRPIDAQLVTISACYGSGTRQYAGEGLVGLSWAFLHAGAHSVIGALWEVSDESTPRLMDSLYAGLEAGQPPSVALRQAKLALIRAGGQFGKPFYWAPFQLYTRQ